LAQGFQTIRIPATEVLRNMENVVTFIVDQCRERAYPNPPRNGEGDHPKDGGGAVDRIVPPFDPANHCTRPLRPFGPPPRSGEDLK
jgi:hypothetical protein